MLKRKWITGVTLALILGLVFCSTAYATNQNQQQQNQSFNNGQHNGQDNNNGNNLSAASRYMINKGIIKGVANGNYNMFHSVRRCDMMIMLTRAFGLEYSGNCNFRDVSSDKYYYNAVTTAQGLGIAKGDGKNFNPETSMTLEEAITFVERTLDKLNIDSDVDLYAIFEDRDLDEYATREDIAVMLYAVLADEMGNTTLTNSTIISYETDEETAIDFDEDDFNDICETVTGETLDYVEFKLPANGTLYYDYDGSDEDPVSTSDEYYFDDSPAISDVTFVPNDDYTGMTKVYYTAYSDEGDSYSGVVKITVGDDEETVVDAITYETEEEEAVTFDEDDFNEVCDDATGDTLDYIKFTLPSSAYGKLYYDYDDSEEDPVSTSDEYYYNDSPSISDVTFVPADNYTGTVKIYYTGYNSGGDQVSGVIKIKIID